MDKDELIKTLAEVITGLQVPVSLRGTSEERTTTFGTAYAPWAKLHQLLGSGWITTRQAEERLHELLDCTPLADPNNVQMVFVERYGEKD